MANAVVYVDSGAGGANNGTSWVNAYTTLAAAITASGTGGTDFYVKSTHTEGAGGATTLTFKGLAATPDRVFSCGSTNSPPTTGDLTFGALINTSVSGLVFNGYVYLYGCQFQAAANNFPTFGNTVASDITLQDCKIVKSGTAASLLINPSGGGTNGSARVTFINTTLKFSATGDKVQMRGGTFRWLNTPSAVDGTGSIPTTFFTSTSTSGYGANFLDGVDLSAVTPSKAFCDTLLSAQGFYQVLNCKLGSGMTFGAIATPNGPTIDLLVTDSTATNYNQGRINYQGNLLVSTSVYNNATDGTTPISWQVITTAGCNPQSPFDCWDIIQWAAAGTYAASKIYFTSATASLKTNDAWVDVEYLGSSYPQASPATTLGAASGTTNLPQIPQGTTPGSITSGVSWATGGLGNNYSLGIPSFTTSAAGYVRFRVKVGKPSLTLNIDPAVTIA